MMKIAVIGIVGNSVFLPVKNFHVGGETVEASSVRFELGGKGFNQAVACARYGAEVSFLGAIGKDFHTQVKDFLENENIKPCLAEKDGNSAFAAIITDESGSNRVTVYQGVSLCEKDVEDFEQEIASASVLLINNEVEEQVNVKAIEIAKKYGVTVILNPAPARQSSPFILDNVDIFTPNEFETLGLEDKNNVIVTLGKRGCLIKAENKIIPARNFGKVVDTTGAGDTFNGVFAVAMAEFNNLEKACELGNVAASLGVTRTGAVTSIPVKEEILSKL